MPAAFCTDPIRFDLSQDNGLVQFLVLLTWDGVSAPPSCDGVVSSVFYANNGQKNYYARLPSTRKGPAVYWLRPGMSETFNQRSVLHAVGLDDRSDVLGANGLGLSMVPPQAGETLINP